MLLYIDDLLVCMYYITWYTGTSPESGKTYIDFSDVLSISAILQEECQMQLKIKYIYFVFYLSFFTFICRILCLSVSSLYFDSSRIPVSCFVVIDNLS